MVTIDNLFSIAITIASSIIAAAWCITHATTINASATVERGRHSIWGVSLNIIGSLILIYGFIISLMMIGQFSTLTTLLLGILLFFGLLLSTSIATSGGGEKGTKGALEDVKTIGIIPIIVITLIILLVTILGGESGLMEVEALRSLMGALTMIGAAFAAALCIVAAVKAGSEMLLQRPELSIWSLLFVALGEGLAIYGLIVAILLVS
ncbi:MAG: ATP synthase subunit C [Candidatus Bathyarchaeia archaeon]